jgi:hypothetical protein
MSIADLLSCAAAAGMKAQTHLCFASGKDRANNEKSNRRIRLTSYFKDQVG